jgi:hypothetical protein
MSKKDDPIKDRAQTLVDTFSDKDGMGSALTNCACWPNCLHAEPSDKTC